MRQVSKNQLMKDYYIDSPVQPPPRPQRARRRQSPQPTPCRAAAADDAVLPLKVASIAAAGQVHVPRPPSPDVSVVPPTNISPKKQD